MIDPIARIAVVFGHTTTHVYDIGAWHEYRHFRAGIESWTALGLWPSVIFEMLKLDHELPSHNPSSNCFADTPPHAACKYQSVSLSHCHRRNTDRCFVLSRLLKRMLGLLLRRFSLIGLPSAFVVSPVNVEAFLDGHRAFKSVTMRLHKASPVMIASTHSE